MERYRIIYGIVVVLFLQGVVSCKYFAFDNKEDFEGIWTSTIGDEYSDIKSVYIKKDNEDIFDCYFISSNGDERAYKALFDNEELKIGNDYTIKYLKDAKQLYIVERSIPLKKAKPFEETLEEFKKSVIEQGNSAEARFFMYFPFKDSYANILGGGYNYSMWQAAGNIEKIKKLFSQDNINCLKDSNVISYKKPRGDEMMFDVANFIKPYEYVIWCNDGERSCLFLFSLRNGEYKITELLYTP